MYSCGRYAPTERLLGPCQILLTLDSASKTAANSFDTCGAPSSHPRLEPVASVRLAEVALPGAKRALSLVPSSNLQTEGNTRSVRLRSKRRNYTKTS
jgi:hypothetical protein